MTLSKYARCEAVREAVSLFESIPPELTAELAGLRTVSQEVWVEARKESDFGLFAPYLEQMIGLNQRLAEGYRLQRPPLRRAADAVRTGTYDTHAARPFYVS